MKITAAQKALYDLDEIFYDCISDLTAIGCYTKTNIEYSYSSRLSSLNGLCEYDRTRDVFHITLNMSIFVVGEDIVTARSLFMHEIVHAMGIDCMDHKGRWLDIICAVDRAFPGRYHIERNEDYIIRRHCKYIIRCTGCGRLSGGQRMTALFRDPSRYECAFCGGSLVTVLTEPARQKRRTAPLGAAL